MITEVALITISCVLFVQMGLADAIQEVVHIRLRIVSCQKCLTWWVCLGFMLWHKYGLVLSVATSFLCSYCALWIALLYDSLAKIYNYLYEQITTTQDTSEDAEGPDCPSDAEARGDEVSVL